MKLFPDKCSKKQLEKLNLVDLEDSKTRSYTLNMATESAFIIFQGTSTKSA